MIWPNFDLEVDVEIPEENMSIVHQIAHLIEVTEAHFLESIGLQEKWVDQAYALPDVVLNIRLLSNDHLIELNIPLPIVEIRIVNIVHKNYHIAHMQE